MNKAMPTIFLSGHYGKNGFRKLIKRKWHLIASRIKYMKLDKKINSEFNKRRRLRWELQCENTGVRLWRHLLARPRSWDRLMHALESHWWFIKKWHNQGMWRCTRTTFSCWGTDCTGSIPFDHLRVDGVLLLHVWSTKI